MTGLAYGDSTECYNNHEWCGKARFSPALFFKLQRKGEGPKVTRIGARTIVVESPREYFARRERESASALRTAEAV